jgi:N utilization substance protein B
VRRALDLARGAWSMRAAADAELLTLAPTWPAHRQASVDRALLRLAYYEMTGTKTHPKIVVNEAVELAKEFGGEKSPGFVNGLLDKILKRVLAERPQAVEEPPSA